MHPIPGCVCSVSGERILSPYAVSGIDGEPRCRLCRRIQPPFAKAVAYGSYEGGLRELIHLLKYGAIQRASRVLGRMLADAIEDLESDFPRAHVAVVSLPLDRAKPGQWCGRSGFRHAKWKSCDVRKAMKRLSGWRQRPAAQ
jgi:predicted amidophosphoribosyltransferase